MSTTFHSVASRVSRSAQTGAGCSLGGLALPIFVGAFGGLWLAFIGWVLLAATEAELALVAASRRRRLVAHR